MGCIPAPACKAALAEATRLHPNRRRTSDGICGDEAHQKRRSDHNDGNAWDLSHDPANGCDAHEHMEQIKARRDPRVKYIISKRRIWNPSISPAWRPYSGPNPHESHAHVSIHAHARGDTRPWFGEVATASTPTRLEAPRMVLYWHLNAIYWTDGRVRSRHGYHPHVLDQLVAGGARVVGRAGQPNALHGLPVAA